MKICFLFAWLLISCAWMQGQDAAFSKKFKTLLQKKDYQQTLQISKDYLTQHPLDTTTNVSILNTWMLLYAETDLETAMPLDSFLALMKIANPYHCFQACSNHKSEMGKGKHKQNIEKILVQCLEICKQAELWDEAVSIAVEYANICYFTSNYGELEARYLEAIKIGEQHPAAKQSLEVAYTMTFYYYFGNQRDFEKAAIYLNKLDMVSANKAANIVKKIQFYSEKGDEERALEYANVLLEQQNAQSIDTFNLLQVYFQLVHIYLNQNQLLKAKKYFEKIEEIRTNLQPNEEMLMGFLKAHFPDLMLRYSTMAKSPIVGTFGNNNGLLGSRYPEWLLEFKYKELPKETFLEWLSFNEQIIVSSQAILLQETAGQYLAIGNGYAYYQQDSQALDKYNLGLQIATSCLGKEINLEASNNYRSLLQLLKGKMQVYKHLQTNADTILKTANQAIGILDKLRQSLSTRGAKENVLNDAPMLYETALEAFWKKYQTSKDEQIFNQAFQLAEKSKAILLLETLKENEARNFGGVPDSLRQLEKSLINDVALYEAESKRAQLQQNQERAQLYNGYLTDKRSQLERLKKQLETQYPRYFQLKYNQDIASVKDIQTQLQQQGNTALVEFFVGEKQIHIFLIQPNQTFWISKPRTATFFQDIQTFYKALTDVNYLKNSPEAMFKDFTTQAHQFYQLFLQEAIAQLAPNIQNLTIISDGLMCYIPIEVLLQQPANDLTMNYGNLAYLIKKYAISYHYSATLWLETAQVKRSKKAPKNELLAFAPSYNQATPSHRSDEIKRLREHLSELAGTQAELSSLQKIFSGQFFAKEQATEQQFKKLAGDYQLLHLAMHGLVNNENPIYSGLAFTENSDTSEDNILYAYELQNIELHADLVTLSACETGYGKYQNGEGVVSLGRGFMYTGIPSVVMTLWAINDQATASLMQHFYTELQKGTPKHQALQKAKIMFLEKNAGIALHPMFWSAFVLVGNTDPVSSSGLPIWIWVAGGAAVAGALAWGIWRKRPSSIG